jgi:lysyl-tRNA synthetase class II/acyl-CoA reductase-like NAD-dependent aldehyde dehydrogenase
MLASAMTRFAELGEQCALFADHLRDRREQIQSALAAYASVPAVDDEIARATYLLDNLEENREYFQDDTGKAGAIAAFLPRNQLLYATVYMGVVPAMMSNHCHVRPPESAHPAYRNLIQAVDFAGFLPDLHFSLGSRVDFVASRARAADVVIFTGTYANGELVRKQLKRDALFLFSGSGHNPVVVRKDADLEDAAAAIVQLCYHNQGQDCSAPNAVLVDRAVSSSLFRELHERTLAVEAAMKLGRHSGNVIAANTDGRHLVTTAETFLKLQPFLVHGGSLNTQNQVISPAIFRKPLSTGPHLTEFFAPVIMLQEYDDESELRMYFNHPRYRPNAMYLTVFGQHARIEKLGELDVHPPDTILHNRDLHVEETGTRPYGGYGTEASFTYFAGVKRLTPILPQREIHRHLVALRQGEVPGALNGRGRNIIWTARDARLERLRTLSRIGVTVYPPRFAVTASCQDLVERYTSLPNGECTTDLVTVAGRIVAHRNSGMFLDLRDNSGKIQILCHESMLGERSREILKLIDPGDLLGVSGRVRRTQRGELTVAAETLTMLAKDLRPAAQSVAGSRDDTAARPNPTSGHLAERQHRLLARAETVAAIRTLMSSQLFQDAETWTAEPRIGGDPEVQLGTFMTPHFGGLLADGLADRFYEINRYSADGESKLGQAIIVNAAQAFVDWREMMELTEKLINSISQRLRETGLVSGYAVDCPTPFTRKSMIEAIADELGVDYSMVETGEQARDITSSQGCDLVGNETWAECVTLAFVSKVAAKLITPVHITYLPRNISPLAVADPHDKRLVEGFATYINGRLIANGSTILNNPFEYRERLTSGLEPAQTEAACGEQGDHDLVAALERGIPPAAGMRAALDRLVP